MTQFAFELKLAQSRYRSLLPSQLYLLCRFSSRSILPSDFFPRLGQSTLNSVKERGSHGALRSQQLTLSLFTNHRPLITSSSVPPRYGTLLSLISQQSTIHFPESPFSSEKVSELSSNSPLAFSLFDDVVAAWA
jgi:hypothetical protein